MATRKRRKGIEVEKKTKAKKAEVRKVTPAKATGTKASRKATKSAKKSNETRKPSLKTKKRRNQPSKKRNNPSHTSPRKSRNAPTQSQVTGSSRRPTHKSKTQDRETRKRTSEPNTKPKPNTKPTATKLTAKQQRQRDLDRKALKAQRARATRRRAKAEARRAANRKRAAWRAKFLAGKVAVDPKVLKKLTATVDFTRDLSREALEEMPTPDKQSVAATMLALSELKRDGTKAKQATILRHLSETNELVDRLHATAEVDADGWVEDGLWEIAHSAEFGRVADKIAAEYHVDVREVYTLFFSM